MSEHRQRTGTFYPLMRFQGVPTRPLALPTPATADSEERAFLIEVASIAMKELQYELRQYEEEEC